jgi:hypothetical protein
MVCLDQSVTVLISKFRHESPPLFSPIFQAERAIPNKSNQLTLPKKCKLSLHFVDFFSMRSQKNLPAPVAKREWPY